MVKFVVIRNEDDEAKAYYTIKYDDKFKMYELYFSNSLSNLEGCPKYEFLLERSFENEEVIKLVLLNSDGRFFDLICKK